VTGSGPAGLRVLVVDDDATCRDIAVVMLERLGHHAVVAASGATAVEIARGTRFDVVLMDVHLPGIDGREATRRLRSCRSGTVPPSVIAMTASSSDAERRACLGAGMDGVLVKPLHLRPLSAALDRRRPATPPAAAVPAEGASTLSPVTFDPTVLEQLVDELCATGTRLREDLIETYLLGDGRRLADLATAGRMADGATLAFVAHELRSASASLGLLALSAAAGRIDDTFRDAPTDLDVAGGAAALAIQCLLADRALRRSWAEGSRGLTQHRAGDAAVRHHLAGGHGPGEEVALVPVAVQLRDIPPLLGRLDPLGHHGQVQPVGQGHHGLDDQSADRAVLEVTDERLVDLDDVDRQVLQVAQ
jgi:CheY-like chemotaxis protein